MMKGVEMDSFTNLSVLDPMGSSSVRTILTIYDSRQIFLRFIAKRSMF